MIKLRVKVNDQREIKGIYDTGANASFINQKIIDQIKANIKEDKSMFKTINGKDFTSSRARLKMRINKIEKEIDVYIVRNDNFTYDLILGLDAIREFRLRQDENLRVSQKLGDKEEIIADRKEERRNNQRRKVNVTEHKETGKPMDNLEHLNNLQKTEVSQLIERYKDVFAKHKFDVGTRKSQEASIKLIENKYISKKPYRCSIPDQREIEFQITKLLEHDLIEESSSPFAAPVTLAFKKESNRRDRLCIDFREINKIVVPEPQPFPRIEDIIVKAGNCHFFSTFDINSAFWSIPIKKEDREKTAFITQNGHWQWKCLPFGLKISPAIFQRVLANTLRRNGLAEFCMNYIDDILVFSETFDQHIKHIEQLMKTIRKEGFRLKLAKCKFAENSVKYLGHIIEKDGVRPGKDNLKAIRDFERPRNKKNVRQLLGKINFYYKFIEDACKLLEPLHNLLRKNTEFIWNEECEKAFKKIKEYLCSSPILSIYDHNREVFIYTDASGDGLGAVLKQPQDNGMLHPVAYFSRRLKPTETKKKAIHLECLAIKEAIQYWQHWLIGRHFTVLSDHKPLESMRVKARTDEILGDLMHYLSQYDFKIIYSPGKHNIEADALSRNPVLESFEDEEEVLKVANIIKKQDIIRDQKENREDIKNTKDLIKKSEIFFKNIKGCQRIVVSQEFGEHIIKTVHDFFGHVGRNHILKKIRPFYYFKNMDRIVDKFCKQCEICIKNKSRTRRPIGLMSRLGPARKPFEIMSFDTIGGFSNNNSPKKYMHILIDHFSRAVFMSTSKTQRAEDIIKLMNSTGETDSIKIILADRYPAMTSKEIQEYAREKNIKLIFTSTDCPSSNGLNERVNQTLVNRIRCKINSKKKE